MRKRGGFTLLEIMITCTLLAVLGLIMGGAILGVMRVSAREQAVLEMDQEAIRILETLKQTLRSSYIPVAEAPLSTGRTVALGSTNHADNVESWREVLVNGTDLFIFVVGIDTEGDGDIIYGDSSSSKRLAFGLDVPGSGLREATDKDEDDDLNNLGIIDVDPVADFSLATDNSSDIDVTLSRFDDTFSFPSSGSRQHIYGVIRFLPYRENGAEVLIREADLDRKGMDLNDDGDITDVFALGRLQIVYPESGGGVVAFPISGTNVLLQVNRDDITQKSLFQLMETKSTKGSALQVNLLLCNYNRQIGDKLAFSGGSRALLVRSYESLLKTQLMMTD